MDQVTHDIIYTDIERLHANPLEAKLYGADEPADDLEENIRQYGIRVPLLITTDGMVISGVRRLKAACKVGLQQVPVYYAALTDPTEIELAVIDCNRQREKTKEQRMREFAELKRIEAVLAERRKKTGKNPDGTAGGRGNVSSTFNIQVVPGPTLKPGETAGRLGSTGDIKNLTENFRSGLRKKKTVRPRANRSPTAAEIAAKKVGLSDRTAMAATRVVEYADATGDRSVIEIMEKKSVTAAVAAMEAKISASQTRATVPPLKIPSLAVWQTSGPVAGMGLESEPDRLSGDLVRSLYFFFTVMGDQVIALSDPAGVALDAARCFVGQKADGWSLACQSFALKPVHPEVVAFDFRAKPHLPPNTKGAGLFFLDAPAWVPTGGGPGESPLRAYQQQLLAFLEAAAAAVRPGGYVALLVSATRQGDERIEHAAHLVVNFTKLTLRQHLIVQPETSGWALSSARQKREIIDNYRDLLVFQRPWPPEEPKPHNGASVKPTGNRKK